MPVRPPHREFFIDTPHYRTASQDFLLKLTAHSTCQLQNVTITARFEPLKDNRYESQLLTHEQSRRTRGAGPRESLTLKMSLRW